jgi:HAD superfamily hydrolase (TIGR01459 family)
LRGMVQLNNTFAEPQVISGLGEIAHNYSGFMVDLWGVIHNGCELFPGTIPCLQQLKDAGKTVVLLSNAPRCSGVVMDRLSELGLPRDLYTGIITSGDMTHDYLQRHLAETYFHIGHPEKDNSLLVGIGMNPVSQMFDADIIIASNFFEGSQLQDYEDDFNRAIQRQIPMVCANPDLYVIRGNSQEFCSGALAQDYEKCGGEVMYFGKPYEAIYQHLMAKYGSENWLAIGDSLETDIKGANQSGIDSWLVLSGVHNQEISLKNNVDASLFDKHESQPRYISEHFTWK